MAKIEVGQAIDLMVLSKIDGEIGDLQWSNLTPIDFNEEKLGTWKLCEGVSCAGSAYEAKTGNSVVPNAMADGAFLRQAKPERSVGTNEADQMQGHMHQGQNPYSGGGSGGTPLSSDWITNTNRMVNGLVGNPRTDGSNGIPRTGLETRPNNIASNLYVKIDY